VLNEDEKKTLLDVKRRLLVEDPDFVHAFQDRLGRQPTAKRRSSGIVVLAGAMLLSLRVRRPHDRLRHAIETIWVMWVVLDLFRPPSCSALTRAAHRCAAMTPRRRRRARP
jgi:hypothetical protein